MTFALIFIFFFACVCTLFGDDVCTQVIIKLFMALNTLYLPIYLSSAVKCLSECEWVLLFVIITHFYLVLFDDYT